MGTVWSAAKQRLRMRTGQGTRVECSNFAFVDIVSAFLGNCESENQCRVRNGRPTQSIRY